MINKGIRLAKALQQETVKRLPWVFILFALLLLFQGVENSRIGRQTAQNTNSIVRSQQKLLDQQKESIDNQGKIIKNLAAAVDDLKKNNAQQTDYLQCLLALQGQPQGENDCVKPGSTNQQSIKQPGQTNSSPSPTQSNSQAAPQQPSNTPAANVPVPKKPNVIKRIFNKITSIL